MINIAAWTFVRQEKCSFIIWRLIESGIINVSLSDQHFQSIMRNRHWAMQRNGESIQWTLCGGTPNVPSGCPTFLLQHSLYKENHVIWSKHKTVKVQSCFLKSALQGKLHLLWICWYLCIYLAILFAQLFASILSIRKTMSSACSKHETPKVQFFLNPHNKENYVTCSEFVDTFVNILQSCLSNFFTPALSL